MVRLAALNLLRSTATLGSVPLDEKAPREAELNMETKRLCLPEELASFIRLLVFKTSAG